MILGILRQFQGYTLSSLLDEDAELIRLLAIEKMGTKGEVEADGEQG